MSRVYKASDQVLLFYPSTDGERNLVMVQKLGSTRARRMNNGHTLENVFLGYFKYDKVETARFVDEVRDLLVKEGWINEDD